MHTGDIPLGDACLINVDSASLSRLHMRISCSKFWEVCFNAKQEVARAIRVANPYDTRQEYTANCACGSVSGTR
jgi:hypothetical protein